ncbi:MAG: DUF3413 domain-containing protein [Bacteriovoracia bacterium]
MKPEKTTPETGEILSRKEVISWSLSTFITFAWFSILFIGLNYFQSLIFPQNVFGWIYYIFTFIGHYGLLISLIFLIFVLPLALLKPRQKFVMIWSTFILVLLNGLLLIDSFVFSQYRFHLNWFVVDLLVGGAAGDIFHFSLVNYVFVIGYVSLLTLGCWLYANYRWTNFHQEKSRRFNKNLALLIFGSLFASHGLHIYGAAADDRSITKLAGLFPVHYPATANSFFRKKGITFKHVQKSNEFDDFFYPQEKMVCPGSTNKNILFLVIDSWRHDQMDQEITPAIAKLGEKGIKFQNHFSGSNNTRGGIFSLFYGLPAIYWDKALKNRRSSVFIDELQERNYELGIFSSASLASPEFDKTVFTNVKDLRISTPGSSSVEKDLKITDEWKEWLQKRVSSKNKKPFFGFLFYDSPHSYAFPDNFKTTISPVAKGMSYVLLNNNTDPLPYLNRHKMSVKFVDTLINDVVSDLRKKKLLEETIIVVTGDHGQELNDNKKNFWGHNSNYTPVQLQVPLVIHWPGKNQKLVEDFTSHYDIVPTFMDSLWECKNDVDKYSYGQSLFKEINRRSLLVSSYLDYSVLDFNKNHIMTIDQFGDYEVTDFKLLEIQKTEADQALLLSAFKDLSRFSTK